MRLLRRLFLCVAAVGVVGAFLLPATASADEVTRIEVFSGPTDSRTYDVTADLPGRLHVDTMDCCIPGDLWGSQIFKTSNGTGQTKRVCGNGSTTEFSGLVVTTPTYVTGKVKVTYCHGTDIFPAQMLVRFRHPGTLTVTP